MEFTFDNIRDMQAKNQLCEGFMWPISIYSEQVYDFKIFSLEQKALY